MSKSWAYQLETQPVSICRRVVHCIVTLIVSDPWVSIVSQQILQAPATKKLIIPGATKDMRLK